MENMGFVLRFSATVLANTLAYQREMLLRKHNVALLEMARNLFSSVSKFSSYQHKTFCLNCICIQWNLVNIITLIQLATVKVNLLLIEIFLFDGPLEFILTRFHCEIHE